jgi:hypothetical protein
MFSGHVSCWLHPLDVRRTTETLAALPANTLLTGVTATTLAPCFCLTPQDAGKLRSPNGLHSGGAPTPPAAAGAGPSPAAWQQSGYQVPAIPVAP